MKKYKFFIIFIAIFAFLALSACESATTLKTASISEITAAGSKNYGVKISFANDSRLEGKWVDVQVKFNKLGTLTLWEEHNEKLQFEIDEVDEWYSLTSIFVNAKGSPNTEDFEKHNQALTRTYLFNYDGKININFRVVAGEKEENSDGSGYILVGSEPISDQFVLKIQ